MSDTSNKSRQGAVTSVTAEDIALLERFIRAVKSVHNTGAKANQSESYPALAELLDCLSRDGTDSDSETKGEDEDESDEELSIWGSGGSHAVATSQTSSNSKSGKQTPSMERPHAAVERRYRCTINEKIRQLNDCIPEFEEDDDKGGGVLAHEHNASTTGAKERATKSVVLDRAAKYINRLVHTYQEHEGQCNDLRDMAQRWLSEIDRTNNGQGLVDKYPS